MDNNTYYTETGLRLEGPYENNRNSVNSEVFKAVIREVYGVKDVICAHHLVFVVEERRHDGFVYSVVVEVPSADTLIFDQGVAKKIWGSKWAENLTKLALEPVETRDALFSSLYTNREHWQGGA